MSAIPALKAELATAQTNYENLQEFHKYRIEGAKEAMHNIDVAASTVRALQNVISILEGINE
jgi:hypothetical protein